jgi:molybdopterin-guanine dinucleotide biosynthesis protein A
MSRQRCSTRPAPLRSIPDLYPGFGPVGGILTALRDAKAEWAVVAACDMPFVSAELLARMLERAADCGGQALVAATPDGRSHPLCAVYHRSAAAILQECVDQRILTMRVALKSMNTVPFDVDDPRLLTNVNTPAEWESISGEQE